MAGLDLDVFLVLSATCSAQANVAFFLLPQPRQPGSGLGLEGTAAGFDYVLLVSELKMPGCLPAPLLGRLEKAGAHGLGCGRILY